MDTVIIRDARLEDAQELAEAEQTIAQTPGFLVSKPFELKVEKFQSKIEELSQNSNSKYIVAEVNHQIVGHALLEPLHLSAIQHVVHLTIAVHEGSQEKGIGKAMLGHLLEWAKKTTSVEKIELHVRSSNKRAISLYRKFGFQEEGRWKRRVKIKEGQYLDDVLMGFWVGPSIE
jgi:RimJ/RimL family protein N-acetyltransferase